MKLMFWFDTPMLQDFGSLLTGIIIGISICSTWRIVSQAAQATQAAQAAQAAEAAQASQAAQAAQADQAAQAHQAAQAAQAAEAAQAARVAQAFDPRLPSTWLPPPNAIMAEVERREKVLNPMTVENLKATCAKLGIHAGSAPAKAVIVRALAGTFSYDPWTDTVLC